MPDQLYEYRFGISVCHGCNFSKHLDELIQMTGIFSTEKTENDFNSFRLDLKRDGFDLHEVSRREISSWEVVRA
jgi:hypothetical protein